MKRYIVSWYNIAIEPVFADVRTFDNVLPDGMSESPKRLTLSNKAFTRDEALEMVNEYFDIAEKELEGLGASE